MSGYTIDEARRIAINCASSYKSSLEDKQFIISGIYAKMFEAQAKYYRDAS